jgi:hypothetical protein
LNGGKRVKSGGGEMWWWWTVAELKRSEKGSAEHVVDEIEERKKGQQMGMNIGIKIECC